MNTVISPATLASDNKVLFISALSQTLAYNADGTLASITVTNSGRTYKQSFSYTNGVVTSISNWVLQ